MKEVKRSKSRTGHVSRSLLTQGLISFGRCGGVRSIRSTVWKCQSRQFLGLADRMHFFVAAEPFAAAVPDVAACTKSNFISGALKSTTIALYFDRCMG